MTVVARHGAGGAWQSGVADGRWAPTLFLADKPRPQPVFTLRSRGHDMPMTGATPCLVAGIATDHARLGRSGKIG